MLRLTDQAARDVACSYAQVRGALSPLPKRGNLSPNEVVSLGLALNALDQGDQYEARRIAEHVRKEHANLPEASDLLARMAPDKGAEFKHLVDLPEFDVQTGPWKLGKGQLNSYPITVNTVKSPHGLGMHPPANGIASVKYRLGKSAKVLRASVGLSDIAGGAVTPIIFQVFGDGRLLWSSKLVQKVQESQPCTADLAGVDVLELRVSCPGKAEGAHAIWIEPFAAQ